MQAIGRQQIITIKCHPKTYVIPLNSIRSLIFNENAKSITINYLNDSSAKTTLYDDNIKRLFYDTLNDMRSCDHKITEYNIAKIIDGDE